ncbi:MAG TPA: hypothetical protein VFA60_01625 [Terriglobales bacterium]|nr:hypothetical protein [Terriglobales bacterium]
MLISAPGRILLVNGDATVQRLRKIMLRQRGYKVEGARTLGEALNMLTVGEFALVMVDVGHNAAEALEFCEQIKATNPAQKLALIANHTLYLPSEACPDEVLSKQDGPEQFLSSVDQMIQRV